MWLQDPLYAGGAASAEQLGCYAVPLRHCFSKAKKDTNVTIIDTEGNVAMDRYDVCSGIDSLAGGPSSLKKHCFSDPDLLLAHCQQSPHPSARIMWVETLCPDEYLQLTREKEQLRRKTRIQSFRLRNQP
jgi:hypothetical protein